MSAPCTDSTSPRNELLLVRPVSICVTPSASTTSSSVPLDPDAPRARRHALADPPPAAVGLVGALLPDVRDRVEERRPERLAPEDHEQRGQHGQHRDHREPDAHRADRAEAGRAVDLGQAQRQQRDDHRQPGGQDRRARPCCSATRIAVVLVLVAAQLLAVAAHQQQRVVRAGAEHEHRQDAAGLPVDRHPRLGEQVAEAARGGLGEQHREERDRPEDRRAVDDDQQDQDDQRGRRRAACR